jgi:hypothetical protein
MLSIAFLILAGPARAELGGAADSIEADQARLKATRSTTDASHYTLHQLQTDSGVTVREYVSSAGTVFAVAWEGPEMPDLQQLLGSYFSRYTEAAQARAGRGALSIELPDLVVQSGGHMRSFAGRAYLPEQLPEGVAPAGLQ